MADGPIDELQQWVDTHIKPLLEEAMAAKCSSCGIYLSEAYHIYGGTVITDQGNYCAPCARVAFQLPETPNGQ